MRFPRPKPSKRLLTRGELTFRRNPANMANVNLVVDKEGEHFDGIISLTCCDPERLTDVHGIGFCSFRSKFGSVIATTLLLRCLSPPHRFAARSRSKERSAHSYHYPAQSLVRAGGFRVESIAAVVEIGCCRGRTTTGEH